MRSWLRAGLGLGLLLLSAYAQAAVNFKIEAIELVGARRITLATVLTYIPVASGDVLTKKLSHEVLRSLYATGFFKDVTLYKRDNVLVIQVKERPAIAEINLEGNRKVKTKDILEAFADVDLTRGRIYNDKVLETMKNEMERLYYSIGRYGVVIRETVTPLPRNRVKIDIDIREGTTAKIRNLNIVGNRQFTDKELLKDLKSGIPKWYAILSRKDEYAKSKLAGDLEALQSFYLDRGYMNFRLDSTQVSISPDKKDIYITINITEGEQFRIRSVQVSGDTVVDQSRILQIANAYNVVGEYFSNAKATQTSDAVNLLLGNKGYAFADTRLQPMLDNENKEVDLNFVVNPGKRVYVRRITFSGNDKTLDRVYRREMRQMEGTWYVGSLIERSKVRIQRLSYVEEVEVEKNPVPGTDDKIDIMYSVKERLSGTFNVGAGFSGDDGFAFSMSVTQSNLFGTGNSLSFSLSTSDTSQVLNIRYLNPYYTQDGISREISIFGREIDTNETVISEYIVNNRGFGLNYGIPLTEYSVFRAGGRLFNTQIEDTIFTPLEILEFLDANGSDYDQLTANLAYVFDTRNRSIFPDKGVRHLVELELAVPGSDLEYYKLDYNANHYWPSFAKTVFNLKYNFAFGDGYGDLDELPFFEHYFAGGITRPPRGYESRSLGPRDSQGDPFGGALLTTATFEYLMPPFGGGASRLSIFYDIGNVYATIDDFDTDELRTSVGLSFRWLAPVGAMTFVWADPIGAKPGDDTETFDFTIGGSF